MLQVGSTGRSTASSAGSAGCCADTALRCTAAPPGKITALIFKLLGFSSDTTV